MNLTNIAALFEGQEAFPSLAISGISIDSHAIRPGFLFVALRGERVDGHDFMDAALAQGAVAILCEQPNPRLATIPQIVVPNSLDALAKIARYQRKNSHCPIIALTGSNGKTTVKEMIASILPQPSYATLGNLNNHIGVPLNVVNLSDQHNYAVFELGANHIGEIAHTVAIVQPHIALINNIAPAHIEGFGSIEGVARAKGEIYEGLDENGIAIINDDDDFAHFWDDLVKDKQVLRFSLIKPVDIYTSNLQFDERHCAVFDLMLPVGKIAIQLQVPGEHSVRNALAAAACCYAAGIDASYIAKGLNGFQGVSGRMTYLSGKNQSLIIDDTYNANLRSVLTAIDVLATRQGCKILVLGDMGELGTWAEAHHKEIGLFAKQQGIDVLMTCGHYSKHSSHVFGDKAKHYKNQDELAHDLLTCLTKKTTVLVKGSRSAQMEKIVQQIVV
jgi:UDP-N-acetylmuramoyl-tripeptide--D-alanyl-D-alanine ligase